MQVLKIDSLKKTYRTNLFLKKIAALKGISLSIDAGTIYGLIGPNGAGKTTAIKAILNLVRPTSGKILIFGRHSRAKSARQAIGYLPEIENYPPYLTGRQFLDICIRFSGKKLTDFKDLLGSLLDQTNLNKALDKKIHSYSKGMKKKLGLLQAILPKPKLLILDEPIEGLDAEGKKIVIDILGEFRREGKSVLMVSHYLTEVEKQCDRVAIIDNGLIVKEIDTHVQLPSNNCYTIETTPIISDLFDELDKKFPVHLNSNGTLFLDSSDIILLNKLIKTLQARAVLIHRIMEEKSSLESIYLNQLNEDHKMMQAETEPRGRVNHP